MYILRILTFFFLVPSLLMAQQTIPISKTDVLEKVKSQNYKLKIGEQDVHLAQGDFNLTNAAFLPNIRASYTGMLTSNPLMAFGFKLNQEIITQADFDPNSLNNPAQTKMFATKFEIEQPILNLDGLYQRRAAKAKLEATQLQLHRTEDFMLFEAENAYMQLQVAYKGLEALESALEAANENLRMAKNNLKHGYLQQSDILTIKVRVTEIENLLHYAKSNIKNTSQYLGLLMNEDLVENLEPLESLTLDTEWTLNQSLPENRADLQALDLITRAYEQNLKADKATIVPRLNAFGSYELYDNQIFQADASGYLFGASLVWDVFDGSRRYGKTKKSKANLEKTQLEKELYKTESQLELNKALRMFEDVKNNLKLANLALEQSQEVLRIRTNRFEQGLEKTSDLLAAETQVLQKQLEYFNTVFKHNYALAYLQLLTKTN